MVFLPHQGEVRRGALFLNIFILLTEHE